MILVEVEFQPFHTRRVNEHHAADHRHRPFPRRRRPPHGSSASDELATHHPPPYRPPPRHGAAVSFGGSARAGLAPRLARRLRLGPLLGLRARLVAPGRMPAVACERVRGVGRRATGSAQLPPLPARADRAAHVAHDEEGDRREDRPGRPDDQPERRAAEAVVVPRVGVAPAEARAPRGSAAAAAAAARTDCFRRPAPSAAGGAARAISSTQREAASRHAREASSPTLAPARPRRPVVRTSGFQPGNAGSIPAGATASPGPRSRSRHTRPRTRRPLRPDPPCGSSVRPTSAPATPPATAANSASSRGSERIRAATAAHASQAIGPVSQP